jgi:macrolide-specific efflux system membrane fusion protein
MATAVAAYEVIMPSFPPFLRRRWPIVAVVALIVIALVVRLVFFSGEEPPRLVTAKAEIADIENTVLATGTLEASELVSVGAQVSGQVVKLHVDLGDRVEAGAPIAEIDSVPQQNALRNAEAALASQRANRAVQEANLKQAEAAFRRQSEMLAADATARADYEAAEAALDATRAQIKALDAQIVQATTSLDTARTNLAYTRITAPMTGTVVAVVTREGQTVNANQSAPTIVKLAKLDTITVNAEISEADVTRVTEGQTVYFTILGEPGKRYYAKLRTVEPAPDSIESENAAGATAAASSAVYYNGLFDVPNPDGKLRIAMTAQVYIVLEEAKQVLTIPASAVERGRGGASVRVVGKDGKPVPRRIEIGINNKATVQVRSGLQPGEEVVIGEAQPGVPINTQQRRRGPMGF